MKTRIENRRWKIALNARVLVICLSSILHLPSSPAKAATVTIPLGQVGSAPATNRSLTITPDSVYQLGLIPLTQDRTYGMSDANGNFACTLPPGTYQCDVAPVWGQTVKTEFYFYVDPSNATQNAAANLLTTTPNTFPPPQYAYSAAASDARYAPAGIAGNNSSMPTNSISNPNGTTNGMYDSAYLPFVTANNITDPSAQEDLSRLLGVIDASGHRTNLVDILLLNSRFKPTNNLSLFCNLFTFASNSWTSWGANFNASAPANTISSATGNSTNTIFFTLPQTLTTNTVVITLRMNHPEYIDQGASQAWCGYNQNLYGLYNTNTADEIWVNAAVQSSASGFQFVEKSNNVASPIYFSVNQKIFSVPSVGNHTAAGAGAGYEPYYYDTKTFCFTADGHGKRQVWVDGILQACGTVGNNYTYISTNYPNTPMQVLVLGNDTNWTLGVIDTFSHSARAFVGEVESVQIYNCYADTSLVYASYQAAQYVPPGHRVDFFIGDSMFDQVVNGSSIGMTNRLSYVMSQQNQQNNWHDYSCTGQTLGNFLQNNFNLLTPVTWMPRDKYLDIRIWTDIGANDQLNNGGTSAFSTYTNFTYAFSPYTAVPHVWIGFLGHPMVGLNFGTGLFVENTNLMMWNNVMFQNRNVYNFSFAACNLIATNTMQNATYSSDGAHMNGPSGWLLVKMMADGLNNVGTVYDPVTNVIYNIP